MNSTQSNLGTAVLPPAQICRKIVIGRLDLPARREGCQVVRSIVAVEKHGQSGWCEAKGEEPVSATRFGTIMKSDLGIKSSRRNALPSAAL